MTPFPATLADRLDLARREDHHLMAVRHRLLGEDCRLPPDRLESLLSTDIGIDRLESCGRPPLPSPQDGQ